MKSSYLVIIVMTLAFACTLDCAYLLRSLLYLLWLYELAVQLGRASKVQRYQPNWASLDKRPLPAWYDQSKVGIGHTARS